MTAGKTGQHRHSARSDATSVQAIITVDQAPMRRAAGDDCRSVMALLENARAAWNRYEREDKPSFARWRAREFGALLSEAREVELQIRDYESLVHEVEMEMRRGFIDPHGAYQRVMARRGNPTAATEETKAPRNDGGAGRAMSDFEKEALFQEWVQRSLGTNPDKMDDDAYSATFEVFKSHMFRARPEEPVRVQPRHVNPGTAAEEEEDEPVVPTDGRVKELYRLLVRRLHPDLRADRNVAVSALWHEVQEAYGASDIAQLELLLALSDIETERFNEETSMSQMLALLAELERALFALNDSLRQARGEDAWDFARSGAVQGLRARVERELQANLRARTNRLALLQQTIASWSRSSLMNGASAARSYSVS
jgi:hypothetical protein